MVRGGCTTYVQYGRRRRARGGIDGGMGRVEMDARRGSGHDIVVGMAGPGGGRVGGGGVVQGMDVRIIISKALEVDPCRRRAQGALRPAESEPLDLYDEELLLVAELFVWGQHNISASVHVGEGIDAPSLSLWKLLRKTRSLSLFRRRIVSICGGFLGLATNTCEEMRCRNGRNTTRTLKTWNASNWMFLLLSRRRFIIILRFASFAMYFVMTLKFARSSRISPSSLSDWRFVT